MEDKLDDKGEVQEEFVEDDAFVGNLRNCPLPSFQVAHDLYEGYFVIVRFEDDDSKPIRIARALSNPISNPDHPNCVLIQYFQRMS